MNSNNQIKFINAITFSMFFFILWTVISRILLNNDTKNALFIIFLVSITLQQFLFVKYKSQNFSYLIPILVGVSINFFLEGNKSIYDAIIIIFLVCLNGKFLQQTSNYGDSSERVKKSIYILIALGILVLLFDYSNFAKYFNAMVLRFYEIYLASSILLLREVRAQQFGIKNNRNLRNNILVFTFIIFMSIDRIFLTFFKIVSVTFKYFSSFLIFIISKVVNFITISIAIKSKEQGDNSSVNGFSSPTPKPTKPGLIATRVHQYPDWLVVFSKIIVVLIIIFVIYKVFTKNRHNTLNANSLDIEEREDILPENKKYKGAFHNLFSSMFKNKDSSEKVIAIYGRFQTRASKKDIFKPHMSASQLKNVVEIYVNGNTKQLDSITEIYNEAKFSDHTILEDQVKDVKVSYDIIKHEMSIKG